MSINLKKTIGIISLSLSISILNAQVETERDTEKVKNFIWFIPNSANKVNGVAVGLQAISFGDEKLVINGTSLSAGFFGMMGVIYAIDDVLTGKAKKNEHFMEMDSTNVDMQGLSISMGGEFFYKIRGVNLAGGITGANSIHGLSVTGIYSKTNSFKGICISGLMNIASKGTGLQIGLFNNCKQLKGLQLGLWNKSGKRGLPFINWGV